MDIKIEGKVIEAGSQKVYAVEITKEGRREAILFSAKDIQNKSPELLMKIALDYIEAKDKVNAKSIENPTELTMAIKSTTNYQIQKHQLVPFEAFMEKLSQAQDKFQLKNTYKKYQASLKAYTPEQVAEIKNMVVDKARSFGIYGSEILGEMNLREMKQRLDEVKTEQEMKEYIQLLKTSALQLERENKTEYKALISAIVQKKMQLTRHHQMEK